MNTMWLVIGILVTLFVIGGAGVMWWMSRLAWRYKFLLVTNKGRSARIIKAKRVVDKRNKNHRYFVFKNNTSELPIKEPNFSFNNESVRLISYTPTGQYAYIEKVDIDKDNYMKFSLEPEERELALWQFNENQKKYSEIDKTQVAIFFGMIALVVIILIGVVYSVVQFTNNADLFGKLSEENSKTTQALQGVASTLERLTEIQTGFIVSASNSNNTIIRQVS